MLVMLSQPSSNISSDIRELPEPTLRMRLSTGILIPIRSLRAKYRWYQSKGVCSLEYRSSQYSARPYWLMLRDKISDKVLMFSRAEKITFKKVSPLRDATNQKDSTNYKDSSNKKDYTCSKENSLKSSAIWDEGDNKLQVIQKQLQAEYTQHVQEIRRQVIQIESEADKAIQEKEKENTHLRIQVVQLEQQIHALETSKGKRDYYSLEKHVDTTQKKECDRRDFDKLKIELQQSEKQNEKLRSTLNTQLIRNEALQKQLILARRKSGDNRVVEQLVNVSDSYVLRKEVEELAKLVENMREEIKHCPSCYTLKAQNESLKYSCKFLTQQLTSVKREQSAKQANLLTAIQEKTQENHFIKKANRDISLQINTREQQLYCSAQHRRNIPHSRKTRDDIVKKCRTLTQSYYDPTP